MVWCFVAGFGGRLRSVSIVGRISNSVMRRMFEIQHAVQYGYRLLHPTIGVLRVVLSQ